MAKLIQSFIVRREYLILATMLIFLHSALWVDFGSPLSRALILIHLGLFLIWQPIQKSDQSITWYNAVIFMSLTLAFSYWINWWLIFVWLILLIGIVGGRVFVNRVERYVYFLVMIFLVSELLVICVPSLFSIADYPSTYNLLQYFIPSIALIILFFPKPTLTIPSHSAYSVDVLYAITASLLAGLLALGSLVIMYKNGSDYFTSLIQTLLVIGICLLLISWLLSAQYGFKGLSQIWERSLLNIGTPFEDWLSDLSNLKEEKKSSKEFLEAAFNKLITLPWMSGIEWDNPESNGMLGKKSKYKINLEINGQPVTLYAHVPTGGALLLHCKLLIRLIEYFYESKLNEHELAKQAHLQAIYETGARITHDIKNLLQSMHSMVTILQADTSETDSKSVLILKKQFPYFIQRLEQAMNKLQTPKQLEHDQPAEENIYLSDWWREVTTHYKNQNIKFDATIQEDILVPFELFNSVIENLLDNAISKRKNDPKIEILVTLNANNINNIILIIADTGDSIDKNVTNILFKEPVKSDSGLGIGLLQAYKHAVSMNYILCLKHNYTGNVAFELRKN